MREGRCICLIERLKEGSELKSTLRDFRVKYPCYGYVVKHIR